MTHGHAELGPQVIPANPTVRAGTLNAYTRGLPLYDAHDRGELHQMQGITGLTLPVTYRNHFLHIYIYITYITYILL